MTARPPASSDAFTGEGGLVETGAGPAFVRAIGRGPPLLVVHGGPGFDQRYLLEPLRALAGRRRLIFADQPGCGGTPTPDGGATLAATVAQCRALLRLAASGGDLGVIAHSWGALVLTAAYADGGEGLPTLREGALINPVAVTRPAWDAAFAGLLGRAPPRAVQDFMRLIGAGEGEQAMAVALPFYTRRGYAVPVTPFPLNAATYAALSAGLGDFDYCAGAVALRALTLIHGTDDFTGVDLLGAFARACSAMVRVPYGHFPFFEAPAEFAAVIGALFR